MPSSWASYPAGWWSYSAAAMSECLELALEVPASETVKIPAGVYRDVAEFFAEVELSLEKPNYLISEAHELALRVLGASLEDHLNGDGLMSREEADALLKRLHARFKVIGAGRPVSVYEQVDEIIEVRGLAEFLKELHELEERDLAAGLYGRRRQKPVLFH